ncbi:hypothetical protein HYQ44_015131 [Verticillium longisporum]|nr:hypothetical protein HYQ44_015131 [Verticillium longisporum]
MSRKPMTRFDRIPEDDGPCLLSTSWQFGILADGYRGARWRLLASVVASRRRSETGFTPGAEGTKGEPREGPWHEQFPWHNFAPQNVHLLVMMFAALVGLVASQDSGPPLDRIAFRRSKHVGDAYFNSTKDTAASGRATAPQSGPSYQKQQA